MLYIIDANNLAGELDILEDKDFDKKLIDLISAFLFGKNNKAILVFDGYDNFGDKFSNNNIEIIRSSKGVSADDKIVEIFNKIKEKEIVAITSDIELKERLRGITIEKNKKIVLRTSSEFAVQLEKFFEKGENNDEEDLEEVDIEDVNKEFLKIWS